MSARPFRWPDQPAPLKPPRMPHKPPPNAPPRRGTSRDVDRAIEIAKTREDEA